jgi:hypothetical protein
LLDVHAFWNTVFELCHRTANIIGSRLDVVRCRGAHVRMAKNPLYHQVRYTEAIQIISQTAPCRVPAVPFGNAGGCGGRRLEQVLQLVVVVPVQAADLPEAAPPVSVDV